MNSNTRYAFEVQVKSEYLPNQSDETVPRYVFAYHITLRNTGSITAQLLTRHWIVTNGNQEVQEVHGEGVVGEKPKLNPGESFSYSSGTILTTPVGAMHGSYQMLAEDGTEFVATILPFTLAAPNTLH